MTLSEEEEGETDRLATSLTVQSSPSTRFSPVTAEQGWIIHR